MKIIDYFIIFFVSIWFIAALGYIIWAKKKGKSMCCGSCSSCRGCKTQGQRKNGC